MTAIHPVPDDAPTVPVELVEFVRAEAVADIDRVVEFLNLGGFSFDEFDAPVIIGLVTVTRLHAWEWAGMTQHRLLGLPAWQDALAELVAGMEAYPTDPRRLHSFRTLDLAVFRGRIELFAWAGPTELQADIALDYPDEDDFVEAVAAFLWANRRSHPPVAQE